MKSESLQINESIQEINGSLREAINSEQFEAQIVILVDPVN
jgi:hypothetical protein